MLSCEGINTELVELKMRQGSAHTSHVAYTLTTEQHTHAHVNNNNNSMSSTLPSVIYIIVR